MSSAWPTPARDTALHGVAGEFVTRTAPHTESDPMALLIQFLVAFGAAAGRNVHYPVEATRHHLNEYAILIGPSGKGRKGRTTSRRSWARPTPVSPSGASRAG
jgi:hypothetical protein